MIDREQLAAALGRLEPRDREILDLSLRRRVPDEDVGAIIGIAAADVARLRAAAVERLSHALGGQRGSDLGHMLKLLLESATWELAPAQSGPARPAGAAAPRMPVAAPRPGPPAPARAAPPVSPARPAAGPVPARPAAPHPTRPGAAPLPTRSGPARRAAAAASVGLALLVPAGVVWALTARDPGAAPGTTGDALGSGTRTFDPHPGAVGDPFPTEPKSAGRYPVAFVRRSTLLRRKPRGKVAARIAAKTEWGTPRIMGVVRRRGNWLAVLAPELENGEVGWIEEGAIEELHSVSFSLHVDLSKRRLVVRKGGKAVRRLEVGVGRPGHSTPRGRYAVTDKLRVNDPSSPYGCCVLALSGHQTQLPAGWPGGDRLAVHATRDTSGLGQAVSLGCMRADPADARWMLEAVPIGAPVFVRA